MLSADPTALVIRTNVVYGPEKVGKNFVYQLVRKLNAKEDMSVPSDQVNTPMYNRDLAMATKLLLEAKCSGVYNVGGPDSECLGRADFAYAVVDALAERTGLDKAHIKPVTTSNAGQTALRPLASGLKMDKTTAALAGWKPRTVKAAIEDWMANDMEGAKPLGE